MKNWLIRTIAAAAGGVAMWAAYPPRNLWFLAIVALGILYATLRYASPRKRSSAWIGFVFGATFWLPLLPWVGVYVGPLPWIALSLALALYAALFGVLAHMLMRLPGAPLWFSAAWVTVEWARSSFPFGGFPWAATAFGQGTSPLLPVAALVGVPGLTAAVALTGAGIAAAVGAALRSENRFRGIATGVTVALIGPIAAAAMWPSVHAKPADRPGESVRVAAIQGNVPRLGLDFAAQRRAVLDNHVTQTLKLVHDIATGAADRPDVVLWPENASDIDPLANPDAAEEITAASVQVGAPILVGTLVFNDDGRPTNTVLVWDGRRGPIGRYDKHVIQPFGEYLPWRSFFRLFSSYADQAGNFRPGTGQHTLTAPTANRPGSVSIGVSTCWEIAFDRSPRAAVHDGAQMLYVPTNNATFGRTEMTYQQLAMSQVRSVEQGRSVVVAATTGVSAIIEPDGHIQSRSQFFTPQTLSATIPLRTHHTIAYTLGPWPQWLVAAITLLGFLVVVGSRITLGKRFSAATSTIGLSVDEKEDTDEPAER